MRRDLHDESSAQDNANIAETRQDKTRQDKTIGRDLHDVSAEQGSADIAGLLPHSLISEHSTTPPSTLQ